MKTLKLALIATILSFAMISYAGNDTEKPQAKKIIKISLTQAMKVPGLVTAMHEQLNINILKQEPEAVNLFSAKVRYNFNYYKVIGTHASWARFFLDTTGTGLGIDYLK